MSNYAWEFTGCKFGFACYNVSFFSQLNSERAEARSDPIAACAAQCVGGVVRGGSGGVWRDLNRIAKLSNKALPGDRFTQADSSRVNLAESRLRPTSGSPSGSSSSNESVANDCGEWFKRVSLSRRPCMTGKGARVAVVPFGPWPGMVQPPAANASRHSSLKA